jgi:hypothetical protein
MIAQWIPAGVSAHNAAERAAGTFHAPPEVTSMVQGKWQITIKTPMGDMAGVLELKVDGTALTGSLSDDSHHIAITDGRIEGNQLSWSAGITKPMRMKFKFIATVDADRISGTAKHLMGKATFSGTRAG